MTFWEAARSHPFTYPGTHPADAFVLVDDDVQDLSWGNRSDSATLTVSSGGLLDDLLRSRGLPAVADRYPVLAYGGNRNPATLRLKLEHYGYVSPGDGVVLPVLPARLRGFDVVAGGLSSQGYLYADMFADERTAATQLTVHVLLLDADQLRVMHDSEGIRTDLYDVAVLRGVELTRLGHRSYETVAMAYVGVAPVVISPLLDSPLAFATVQASGRNLPQFGTTEMVAHMIDAVGAVDEVRAVVAPEVRQADEDLDDPLVLASELMRYLNGQWWWRQHTGQRRLLACERLEALFRARLLTTSRPSRTRDLVASYGLLLDAEDAYAPTDELTLGRAMSVSTAVFPDGSSATR